MLVLFVPEDLMFSAGGCLSRMMLVEILLGMVEVPIPLLTPILILELGGEASYGSYATASRS
jgi:hypothetical protein